MFHVIYFENNSFGRFKYYFSSHLSQKTHVQFVMHILLVTLKFSQNVYDVIVDQPRSLSRPRFLCAPDFGSESDTPVAYPCYRFDGPVDRSEYMWTAVHRRQAVADVAGTNSFADTAMV